MVVREVQGDSSFLELLSGINNQNEPEEDEEPETAGDAPPLPVVDEPEVDQPSDVVEVSDEDEDDDLHEEGGGVIVEGNRDGTKKEAQEDDDKKVRPRRPKLFSYFGQNF